MTTEVNGLVEAAKVDTSHSVNKQSAGLFDKNGFFAVGLSQYEWQTDAIKRPHLSLRKIRCCVIASPQNYFAMQLTAQIAKHLRDVYFGGNWTSVNLRDVLQDVSWQQATTKIFGLNTIATLVFHTNYYVDAVLGVLKGDLLTAKDQYSFAHPLIASGEDWQKMLSKSWKGAEDFAAAIEQLPDDKLEEAFVDEKYGNYYRNLHGIIEHLHYHLGQIVLLKKLLLQKDV